MAAKLMGRIKCLIFGHRHGFVACTLLPCVSTVVSICPVCWDTKTCKNPLYGRYKAEPIEEDEE